MKIFVYGTLKRGYGNNRLLTDSEFLGEHSTSPSFDLIDGGVPFMIHGEFSVRGELYEVDALTRDLLDYLRQRERDFLSRRLGCCDSPVNNSLKPSVEPDQRRYVFALLFECVPKVTHESVALDIL